MPLLPNWMQRRSDLYTTPADVIVYKDGDYAVAVDGKTKKIIARSPEHDTVIQSAIDYLTNGGKIYIARGTYNIYNTITITRSNIKIVGSNISSILKLSTSNDVPLIRVGDGSNFVQHVSINDIHLSGYNSSSGIGIHDYGIYSLLVSNVIIDSFKYGVYLNGTSTQYARDGRIINSYIGGCSQGIRQETYSNDYLIAFNYIYNMEEHGIVLAGGVENSLIGNIIPYGITYDGIWLYNSNRNLILSNRIFGTGRRGIEVGGTSEKNAIIGNYIQGAGKEASGTYEAILLRGTSQLNIVVDNYINGLNITKNGVAEIETSTNNYIESNRVVDVTSDPITIVSSTTYCDSFIYTTLNTNGIIVKNKPITYYDGTYYYIAVWNGSAWVKVQLS